MAKKKRYMDNVSVEWWEKKRRWFNLAVGLTGIISIIYLWPFLLTEIASIIIWGIIANIFYSVGIMAELLDVYYLKGKANLYKYRYPFFIIGTLAYCVVTYYVVWMSYLYEFANF